LITLAEPTFELRPWPHRRATVFVYIYDDTATFLQETAQIMKHPRLAGCCTGFQDQRGGWRHLAAAGFLQRALLGAGYVAHELGHAAFRVMDHYNLQVTHWDGDGEPRSQRHPEEHYCKVLERLNAQFWNEAYRLGYGGTGAGSHAGREDDRPRARGVIQHRAVQ